MTKRQLLVATALGLTIVAAAATGAPTDQPNHQSPAPGTYNNTISAIRDTARHAVGEISAEMTTSLRGFSQEETVNNMFEVEAARLALKRSHNGQVRAFAEQMIAAHTKDSDQLQDLLGKLRNSPSLPKHLDDRRQGMVDELRGARDEDFDGRYLSQQVNALKEALILLRGYGKSGDSSLARVFANQTAVVVSVHLEMVKQIVSDHERKS